MAPRNGTVNLRICATLLDVKTCVGCDRDLTEECFWKSGKTPAALSKCIDCRNVEQRARYYRKLGREVPDGFCPGRGHPVVPPADWLPPSGTCECGCGMPTPIATRDNLKKGIYRGFPTRRLVGHRGSHKNSPKAKAPSEVRSGVVFLNRDGYMLQWAPNHPFANSHGEVCQHRLVVELRLGRFLEPHERVHHKNGDRTDNRPENLELWKRKRPHPAGVRQSDYHCPGCRCDHESA
jgi:hypothetical protein